MNHENSREYSMSLLFDLDIQASSKDVQMRVNKLYTLSIDQSKSERFYDQIVRQVWSSDLAKDDAFRVFCSHDFKSDLIKIQFSRHFRMITYSYGLEDWATQQAIAGIDSQEPDNDLIYSDDQLSLKKIVFANTNESYDIAKDSIIQRLHLE